MTCETLYDTEVLIKDSIIPELDALSSLDEPHADKYYELIEIYDNACKQIEHDKVPYKLLHGPLYFLRIRNDYEADVYKDMLKVSSVYNNILRSKLMSMATA